MKKPGESIHYPDKSDRDFKFAQAAKLRLLTPEYLFLGGHNEGLG